MKRVIAASMNNEALDELVSAIEDDFDYVVSGLQKLDRMGKEPSQKAMQIAGQLQQAIQATQAQIATLIK